MKKIVFLLLFISSFFSCMAQTQIVRDLVRANQKLDIQPGGVFEFGSHTVDGFSTDGTLGTPEATKIPTELAVATALTAVKNQLLDSVAILRASAAALEVAQADSLSNLRSELLDSLNASELALQDQIDDLLLQITALETATALALGDSISVVRGELADSVAALMALINALTDESIYHNSDIIDNGIRAEVDAGGTFGFDYSGGNDALILNDATGEAKMQSKDAAAIVKVNSTEARVIGNKVALQARGSGYVEIDGTLDHGGGFDISEDFDNGSNKIRVKVPNNLTTNYELSFPEEDGELATDADVAVVQGEVDAAEADIATNAADIGTNTANISANTTDIGNLQTLSGRPDGSTHMGAYAGTTIPDNVSQDSINQVLETAVEAAGGDQVISARTSKYHYFDDLRQPLGTNASTTIGDYGKAQITVTSSGTANHYPVFVSSTEMWNHPGCIELTTGSGVANTNGGSNMWNGCFALAASYGDYSFETLIRTGSTLTPNSGNDYTWFVGFAAQALTNYTMNNITGFYIDTNNDAHLHIILDSAAARTNVDLNTAVGLPSLAVDTWYKFKFVYTNSTKTMQFYVDNVLVYTKSYGFNHVTSPVWSIRRLVDNHSAQRSLFVDYYYYIMDISRT